jgi:hypothetical protein
MVLGAATAGANPGKIRGIAQSKTLNYWNHLFRPGLHTGEVVGSIPTAPTSLRSRSE